MIDGKAVVFAPLLVCCRQWGQWQEVDLKAIVGGHSLTGHLALKAKITVCSVFQ